MKIITSTILFLLFISCNKETVKPTGSLPVNNSLVGKWQWVSSIGGLSGKDKQTPQSSGYEISLMFNSDSTYSMYYNGKLSYSGKFSIVKGSKVLDDPSVPVIIYQNYSPTDIFINIGDNTLTLQDNAEVGYWKTFARVK